jgi:hypothetical protein
MEHGTTAPAGALASIQLTADRTWLKASAGTEYRHEHDAHAACPGRWRRTEPVTAARRDVCPWQTGQCVALRSVCVIPG